MVALSQPVGAESLPAIVARNQDDLWRLSPLGYATHFDRSVAEPAHLQLISDKIVDAVMGVGPNRIAISLPPRHAKSTTGSKWTPIWFLDHWPWKRVLLASYNEALAAEFGRTVRDTVKALSGDLRVKVHPSAGARDMWHTTDGGYMISQGMGGSLTGRGAELLIVDDPVKEAASIQAMHNRDGMWDWFQQVAMTRLEPGAVALVIMTRWHEDDLVGRIEKQVEAGGEYWEVIRIPALAEEDDVLGREPGQALWPERYDEERLNTIRRSMTDYGWNALFQQNPMPPGGSIVKRVWMQDRRYDVENPIYDNTVIARWIFVDAAMKDNEWNDYTAMVVLDLLPDYRVLVRDVIRERLEFPSLVDEAVRVIRKYNVRGAKGQRLLRGFHIEDTVSGTSLIQTLRRGLPPGLARMVHPMPVRGSKIQRVRSASVWFRNGSILFPHPHESVPWLEDYESEVFDFPNTAYDDQVDVTAHGIRYLEPRLRQGWMARGMVDPFVETGGERILDVV